MYRIMLCLLLCLLLLGCQPEQDDVEVRLSLLHLPDNWVAEQSHHGSWLPVAANNANALFPVYRLQVGEREFLCDYDLFVYELSGSGVVMVDRARELLERLRENLHLQAFAEPLYWEEASRVVPRMGVAAIQDLESGRFFNVQRRGGTYHADVQPLTRDDTAVMKEIYGGAWSWDRRAIILHAGEVSIAASMNGMPHGQGALTNNFPGHFCIHFLGSRTHGSRNVDLGHMLMIHKAAGTIWQEAREATPEQQVRNFVAAFNQKDAWLTGLFANPTTAGNIHSAMDEYETINLKHVHLSGPATDTCILETEVEVIYTGGRRSNRNALVSVEYLADRWVVDATFLDTLLR
jgi:hypothetical protein